MNVVIYARYSSSGQNETSIEGQLKQCYQYCEEQGYNVLDEYIDRAYSGRHANRPSFTKMLRDSKKGTFEAVVVYQLDRFSRDKNDSVMSRAALLKHGVKLISATENIGDDPAGGLLESMLEGINEYYSRDLSRKVRRGMNLNAEKCLSNGGTIPLGFKTDEDKHYQIDPESAHIIKKIFEMYADGKTISEIADYMNGLGYKTSQGNPFNKNSFYTLLKNKKYIGTYTYNGTEVANAIPRIISDDLFEKVQERLNMNKKAPARSKSKAEYLLTTKLFCGHCKEMMTGMSGKGKLGKVYNYYNCKGRQAKKCNKKMVDKNRIEDLVIKKCLEQLTDSNIQAIAKEVVAICESEKDTSTLKHLKTQLSKNEKKQANAMEAVIECEHKSIRDQLYDKILVLEKEHKELEKEIAKEEALYPKLTIPQIKFFLTSLKDGDINDIKYRRILIKVFINKIFLYDDKITIIFNTSDSPVTVHEELVDEIESSGQREKGLFLDCPGAPRKKE